MAAFDMQLPEEILKDFQTVDKSLDDIMGEMVKAGADVARDNIKSNVPASFKGSKIMNCLKVTRVYKTPSDDGTNCKVAFYGYFVNHRGVTTPAPLVANVFEYGSSHVRKRPFMRKSFNKAKIEAAMLKAQREASGGLLE